MNKKIIYYIFSCIMLVLSSCHGTDTDSIDINIIDSGNKTEYYKDLRVYKATEHKVTYLSFDNSVKIATSSGQLMTSIPDSVDYVSLSDPRSLTEKEISQMKQLKKERSYSFVYEIDIEAIKTLYDALAFDANTNNEKIVDQTTFVQDTLKVMLDYSKNFDGLIINYLGKDVSFMIDTVKTTYISTENAVINLLKKWQTDNLSKFLTIKGYPQNWVNKTLLTSEGTKNIILNTSEDSNRDKVLLTMSNALILGVPTNKFILDVNAVSFAEDGGKIGYWILSDGSTVSAIGQVATIAASTNIPALVQGISINNGSNDYYQATSRYLNVRKGIQIMNPSLKK